MSKRKLQNSGWKHKAYRHSEMDAVFGKWDNYFNF